MAIKMQAKTIATSSSTADKLGIQPVTVSVEGLRGTLEAHFADRVAAVADSLEGSVLPGEFKLQPDEWSERACILWWKPEGAEDECPWDDTGRIVSVDTTWERGERFSARQIETARARALAYGPVWRGFDRSEQERLEEELVSAVDAIMGAFDTALKRVKRQTRITALMMNEGIDAEEARKRVRAEDKAAVANEKADGPANAPAPVETDTDDVFGEE